MTDTTYNVMKPDKGVPIKAWTKGVQLEDAARQQLLNVAQLPVGAGVGAVVWGASDLVRTDTARQRPRPQPWTRAQEC